MKIVMVASESAAYVKAGGLGDVVHSLAKALIKLGHTVFVIMPKYSKIKAGLQRVKQSRIFFNGGWQEFGIYEDTKDHVRYYFVDYPAYYNREYIYATPKGEYEDNPLRFGFLSLASLQLIRDTSIEPDLMHIHDWHTGLVPLYKRLYYEDLKELPVIFTIHNAMHQGLYDPHYIPMLNLPWEVYSPYNGIEFYGKINFLKSGIYFCDVLTTVSPSYAEELRQYAYGLEGLIREKKYFFGILNGIDYDVWNSEKDKYIKHHYSVKNPWKGKLGNKKHLKETFGLRTPDERPLVGMVSRLTAQKGLDIVNGIICEAVREGFDFVFLGSGEEKYQDMLIDFVRKYPENVRVRIEYNEELAHKIFAGSDMFLMPSLFEPCGISQMIAMKYGTVPVVRSTGGLKDTVIDYVEKPLEGNGFTFQDYSSKELMHALLKARVYYDMHVCDHSKDWSEIVKRCMKKDFSWEKSAREYERVYSTATMLKRYGS
ncbi:MAG: glycogen/starch synthase [Aquificaceae bacterium]|nr:glycogen synthase [Aquificaceae bacterium]MDW8422970.1 glycogen/starch synthase [Aquificaceae bacterium]